MPLDAAERKMLDQALDYATSVMPTFEQITDFETFSTTMKLSSKRDFVLDILATLT